MAGAGKREVAAGFTAATGVLWFLRREKRMAPEAGIKEPHLDAGEPTSHLAF
jgi:hypothetical protein